MWLQPSTEVVPGDFDGSVAFVAGVDLGVNNMSLRKESLEEPVNVSREGPERLGVAVEAMDVDDEQGTATGWHLGRRARRVSQTRLGFNVRRGERLSGGSTGIGRQPWTGDGAGAGSGPWTEEAGVGTEGWARRQLQVRRAVGGIGSHGVKSRRFGQYRQWDAERAQTPDEARERERGATVSALCCCDMHVGDGG